MIGCDDMTCLTIRNEAVRDEQTHQESDLLAGSIGLRTLMEVVQNMAFSNEVLTTISIFEEICTIYNKDMVLMQSSGETDVRERLSKLISNAISMEYVEISQLIGFTTIYKATAKGLAVGLDEIVSSECFANKLKEIAQVFCLSGLMDSDSNSILDDQNMTSNLLSNDDLISASLRESIPNVFDTTEQHCIGIEKKEKSKAGYEVSEISSEEHLCQLPPSESNINKLDKKKINNLKKLGTKEFQQLKKTEKNLSASLKTEQVVKRKSSYVSKKKLAALSYQIISQKDKLKSVETIEEKKFISQCEVEEKRNFEIEEEEESNKEEQEKNKKGELMNESAIEVGIVKHFNGTSVVEYRDGITIEPTIGQEYGLIILAAISKLSMANESTENRFTASDITLKIIELFPGVISNLQQSQQFRKILSYEHTIKSYLDSAVLENKKFSDFCEVKLNDENKYFLSEYGVRKTKFLSIFQNDIKNSQIHKNEETRKLKKIQRIERDKKKVNKNEEKLAGDGEQQEDEVYLNTPTSCLNSSSSHTKMTSNVSSNSSVCAISEKCVSPTLSRNCDSHSGSLSQSSHINGDADSNNLTKRKFIGSENLMKKSKKEDEK